MFVGAQLARTQALNLRIAYRVDISLAGAAVIEAAFVSWCLNYEGANQEGVVGSWILV